MDKLLLEIRTRNAFRRQIIRINDEVFAYGIAEKSPLEFIGALDRIFDEESKALSKEELAWAANENEFREAAANPYREETNGVVTEGRSESDRLP